MLLADATSKEQVEAALEAGDNDLRRDIESELSGARLRWERRSEWDYDEVDVADIIKSDEFAEEVHGLAEAPDILTIDDIKEALLWAAEHRQRPDERARRRGHRYGYGFQYGPFFRDDDGGFYSFSLSASTYFDDAWLPKNYEFIPDEMAKEFWEDFGSRFQWETDELGSNTATVDEAGEAYIDYEPDELNEWFADLAREKKTELLKKDPKAAIERFFEELHDEGGFGVAGKMKALREAKLSEEELLSLAHRWFDADSKWQKEEVVEEIDSFLSSISEGFSAPREVVAEFSKADIAALGIRGGVLYEEAPWKLIKLHPGDLRLEGTVMNHCVGDAGMGYVKAVKDGEIEIWSLRSRSNKPRFTLEVDPQHLSQGSPDGSPVPEVDDLGMAEWIRSWDVSDQVRSFTMKERANAIEQIKGNSNRTPGFARARDPNSFKFPDEVTFWEAVLNKLAIDPREVNDMKPALDMEYGPEPVPVVANPGEVCTGFDLPYRPRTRMRRRSSRRDVAPNGRRTSRRPSGRMRS